jgi:hypothetical protein
MREVHYKVIQVDMNLLDECMLNKCNINAWVYGIQKRQLSNKCFAIVKCVLLATKIVKSQKYLYDHPECHTWWEKYNMQILWALYVATV